MTKRIIFIFGCVLISTGFMILIINSIYKSNYEYFMDEVKLKVKDFSKEKDFTKVKDGELIYVKGEYNPVESYDKDFEIKFKDFIVKRIVEKCKPEIMRRLQEKDFYSNLKENEGKDGLAFLEKSETKFNKNMKFNKAKKSKQEIKGK